MSERATIRIVGNRRMQCKDIPDEAFLDAVRTAGQLGSWRTRWDVREVLEEQLGHIPENLFLAKARKLVAAGKLGGCPCGCRGDFHPPEECAAGSVCCDPPTQGIPVTTEPAMLLMAPTVAARASRRWRINYQETP